MKYTKKDTTYLAIPKNDPKDRIEIEVGDSKQPDFKPQLKIMRWDNEINFSLRAPEDPAATVVKDGETIKYVAPDYEMHTYDKPSASDEGGHEFELILKKKPDTTSFVFTIQTKELDFFKQPYNLPSDTSCPENVLGSYAVYHKTKGGLNDAAGMAYNTGKAFHIYRPKVTDAAGNETWGDLYVDTKQGTLSIYVPQTFLDSAVYPVVIDPTFGYTSVGASSAGLSDNQVYLKLGTPDSSGNVDSISARVSESSGTSNFKGLVIDQSASVPNVILTNGIGSAVNFTTVNWYTSTYSSKPSVTGGNNYYASIVVLENSVASLAFDTGSSGDGTRDTSNSYASPANPSTTSSTSALYSIYATYTVTSSNVTVSDSITVVDHLPPRAPKEDITVTESVTVTAGDTSFAPELQEFVFVDDEAVTVDLLVAVAVSDSVAVAENVSLSTGTGVTVADAITLTDTPLIGDVANPSVSDSIALTEAVMVSSAQGIAVMDSPSVNEAVQVVLSAPQVAVTDSVALTEFVTILATSFVAVSDSVSVSENTSLSVQAAADLSVSVSDSVSVSENVSVVLSDPQVAVSDTVSLSEFLSVILVSLTSVSDGVAVSESVALLPQTEVFVSDTIPVAESVNLTVSALTELDLTVSDSVAVAENAAVQVTLGVTVSDSVGVTESVAINVPGFIYQVSVSDTIGPYLFIFVNGRLAMRLVDDQYIFV